MKIQHILVYLGALVISIGLIASLLSLGTWPEEFKRPVCIFGVVLSPGYLFGLAAILTKEAVTRYGKRLHGKEAAGFGWGVIAFCTLILIIIAIIDLI